MKKKAKRWSPLPEIPLSIEERTLAQPRFAELASQPGLANCEKWVDQELVGVGVRALAAIGQPKLASVSD